jgi:tetratricopeptide (TPR) repeat protein
MKSGSQWVLAFLFCALIRTQAQSYGSELQWGVDAYKAGYYEMAIQHFQKAMELDPTQTTPHVYLATTYAGQYIPGLQTEDNLRFAEEAIEQYKFVLDSEVDPKSKITSAKGIAYLYLNMKKLDEAGNYYSKASYLDPKDAENFYYMGVIDWMQAYQPRMDARAKLKLRPGDYLNAANAQQKRVCDELREKYASTVEAGLSNLKYAIFLRPDYDDAMAYMNLMYRERADLECDNPSARYEDLKTADEWVDRTLVIKKAKADKASAPTAPNPQ